LRSTQRGQRREVLAAPGNHVIVGFEPLPPLDVTMSHALSLLPSRCSLRRHVMGRSQIIAPYNMALATEMTVFIQASAVSSISIRGHR
jgi:hypothetical protein